MKLGIDGLKLPEAKKRGPFGSLDLVKELGLEGIFFSSILDMSETLDLGLLRSLKQKADYLGLYLESGIGKVNPYCSAESPELRAIGNGDIIAGYIRMIEACAAIDCRELWMSPGNFKPTFPGRFASDRFRTDVAWQDQLLAIQRVLITLAPVARTNGVHLNMETHDEITSFEILRLIETIGDDCLGVVFDIANVLQHGEHPEMAAKRLAPYVRQTHVKDAYVAKAEGGLDFQPRACGEGIVDFEPILAVLYDANPSLNLSLEICQSTEDNRRKITPRQCIQINDPEWRLGHPDLSEDELSAYFLMVDHFEERIAAGEILDWETYEIQNYGYPTYKIQNYGFEQSIEFIKKSKAHIDQFRKR